MANHVREKFQAKLGPSWASSASERVHSFCLPTLFSSPLLASNLEANSDQLEPLKRARRQPAFSCLPLGCHPGQSWSSERAGRRLGELRASSKGAFRSSGMLARAARAGRDERPADCVACWRKFRPEWGRNSRLNGCRRPSNWLADRSE